MAITRQQKEERIEEIQEMFRMAQTGTLVFVSFDGVDAKQMADMHAECFSKDVSFRVVKKTLLKKASRWWKELI